MEFEPRRRTFTLRDLLALTAVIGLLLAVAVPLVNSARARARRELCANRLKEIGLAIQNHHDVYKGRLPAVTSQSNLTGSANVWDTAPGATFAPNTLPPNGYTQSPAQAAGYRWAAGYSWIVRILPYLEETVLYNQISNASNRFAFEAFSTTMPIPGAVPFDVNLGNGAQHFATVRLDVLHCPDFAGGWISTASSGTAQPPVSIPDYASLFNPSARPPSGVAITNYVALSATHLACMAIDPRDPTNPRASPPNTVVEPPNGILRPGWGCKTNMITDGISNTLMVCETKEPAVNSWYDGTVCWTVGANPSASNQPIRSTSTIRLDGTTNINGQWVFPQGTTSASGLNYGPVSNKSTLFAPNGTTPAQTQPVSWGPSSDHPGGVVMHLTFDGAVHAIVDDIDPDLYLALITINGGEAAIVPASD